MRYVGMVIAVLLVALVCVSPASAQTQWVRGTVVSTTADSFTLKAGDADMVFKVTPQTELVARGAGSAQRAAEKAGSKGVKFTDFVKAGEGVEVHYKQDGATMVATEIRAGVSVPAKAAQATESKGTSVMGTVTALTGNSVTLNADGKDWKFMVTARTLIVGHGMGTKSAELKAEGKGATVKDLLAVNDIVTVKYITSGDAMQATDIHMITPALTRK